MSISVLADNTAETRYYNRSIEFEGVAPILLERRYSHGGKEFLPSRAQARWGHGQAIERIQVFGFVLKKDRTTGQQETSIDYVTPASKSWNTQWGTNAPAWVLELFGIGVPA